MILCPRTHLDLDKQSAAMMPNDVSIRHTTSERKQLRSAADLYWTLEFSQRWSASRKWLLLEWLYFLRIMKLHKPCVYQFKKLLWHGKLRYTSGQPKVDLLLAGDSQYKAGREAQRIGYWEKTQAFAHAQVWLAENYPAKQSWPITQRMLIGYENEP